MHQLIKGKYFEMQINGKRIIKQVVMIYTAQIGLVFHQHRFILNSSSINMFKYHKFKEIIFGGERFPIKSIGEMINSYLK